MENDIILDVQHLSHVFRLNRKTKVKAVNDVSFRIKKGEIYGLVGESGSGKIHSGTLCHEYIQTFRGRNLL